MKSTELERLQAERMTMDPLRKTSTLELAFENLVTSELHSRSPDWAIGPFILAYAVVLRMSHPIIGIVPGIGFHRSTDFEAKVHLTFDGEVKLFNGITAESQLFDIANPTCITQIGELITKWYMSHNDKQWPTRIGDYVRSGRSMSS